MHRSRIIQENVCEFEFYAPILWPIRTLLPHSAILLKKTRTQKKDKNKEVWFALLATPQYQQGKKERYKIERKFGEAKQGHGLARCRYRGILKYGIQSYLTAMVLNLKRMVRILTGVGLKMQPIAVSWSLSQGELCLEVIISKNQY